MPGPNQAIASVRAKLYLIDPVDLEAVPINLVEDFAANQQHYPENFRTIGEPIPPDNVDNFMEGTVRWGRVHTLNPVLMRIIIPRVAAFTEHESFRVLALDPTDDEPIALCIGVRPQAFDLTLQGGRAARANYSGICRAVIHGEEIKEALGM